MPRCATCKKANSMGNGSLLCNCNKGGEMNSINLDSDAYMNHVTEEYMQHQSDMSEMCCDLQEMKKENKILREIICLWSDLSDDDVDSLVKDTMEESQHGY